MSTDNHKSAVVRKSRNRNELLIHERVLRVWWSGSKIGRLVRIQKRVGESGSQAADGPAWRRLNERRGGGERSVKETSADQKLTDCSTLVSRTNEQSTEKVNGCCLFKFKVNMHGL